jgi:hypothetical protein
MARHVHEVSTEEIVQGNNDLQELIGERLPRAFPARSMGWSLWAAGFLARTAAILDSISALVERKRYNDAEVALRTLYVTVTTFCWIAIDPDRHIDIWHEGSEAQWEKFDSEALRNFGKRVLSDDLAAELSKQQLKKIDQLADDVDAHWPDHIAAFRRHPKKGKGMLTFRGLYTAIFRTASRIAHAEVDSMQANVRVLPTQTIVRIDEPEVFGRAWMGLPLTAYAVLVFNHHFGWPGTDWANHMIELMNYEPLDDDPEDDS